VSSALAPEPLSAAPVLSERPIPRQGVRRILYFNSWSSAHGGSSSSLIDIVSRLDPRKFDPVVVCPERGELTARLDEIGIPYLLRMSSRLTREELWKFLPEVPSFAMWLRREQIALVHANTGASRRSLVLAAKVAGIPYVQHVRNPVKNARHNLAYRFASRIIANSRHTAASLLADPLFSAKTVTVHNAVDLTQYEATDERREEFGAVDRALIGFVGHLVPNKGTLTVINAMPRVLSVFPNALLAIVGCAPEGEETYEVDCRDRVRELRLESHVRFTGYRRDVPALMRSFDVFVLPTRTETFGKVVIEAMAAACPVVVSDVGGIPEIVERPELGTLIPPDDSGATAEGIIRYLAEPARARLAGAAGQRHVREHFSLDAMVAKLEAVYTSVLAGSSDRL